MFGRMFGETRSWRADARTAWVLSLGGTHSSPRITQWLTPWACLCRRSAAQSLFPFFPGKTGMFTGKATLDVALGGIARVAENDDVAALDGLPAVDELVDEDAFLVVERGHHARAFHLHRLVEEDDDESRDRERDNQVTQPDSEYGDLALERLARRGIVPRCTRRIRRRHTWSDCITESFGSRAVSDGVAS